MRPFFLQSQFPASAVHSSYPQQLTPGGGGMVLPSAAHPHLYHLHCDAAGVSRLPERVPGDGSAVLTAAAGPIVYRDAAQTDTVFCNGWHDAFPATCPPPSFSAAFAAAAGTTSVDAIARGTVATVSAVVAGNTAALSPWKMSSPALFTAPVQSTAIQPVPRFFQPLFSPDVVHAPVKFTGGPMPPPPDCTGHTGNTGGQDGCGDGPIGKRFIPCWHSVAANTTSTLTISASTQTGAALSKCLSASPVVSLPSSAANVFSPVKADKPPPADAATCSAAASSVGPIADCRLDVCDNDDDEDEDDESISDESSSTSNQKDGGKYCECWRCEFFGHADVRLRSFVCSANRL